MDVQLKELIETIKSEGVENAEAKAKEIIAEAEEKRESIIASAEKDAKDLIEKAKEEAAKMQSTAEESIRQAGRDLILSLEKRITQILDLVVKRESLTAMDVKLVQEAILSILKNWNDDSRDIEILVPQEQFQTLEKALLDTLSKELKSGIVLRPSPKIEAGFKISEKNGAAYYDFTASGIAEMLSQFVNPKVSALLRESVDKS